MLRVESRTSAHALGQHCCTNLAKRLQHHAISINVAWKIFQPTTPIRSQHIARWWPNARNMLQPTMLRYVALKCCDSLAWALNNGNHHRDGIWMSDFHKKRFFRILFRFNWEDISNTQHSVKISKNIVKISSRGYGMWSRTVLRAWYITQTILCFSDKKA